MKGKRTKRWAIVAALLAMPAAVVGQAVLEKPDWAFADDQSKLAPPLPDDGGIIRIPGSAKSYYGKEFHALEAHFVPDWFPTLHPAMPPIVATGNRDTKVYACALCHLPTGTGHPESGDLTGLSKAYMIEQLTLFRAGARKGAFKMAQLAKGMTDAEIEAAAGYFAKLPLVKRVKVIETATVAKSFMVKPGGMRVKDPAGGTEPIGTRIIEFPEDTQLAENHDPRIVYSAYVPLGAIARGRALATTGGADGRTMTCAACHGEGLRGVDDIPPLAGRSPTSQVRQLYLFRTGARGGEQAAIMHEVAKALTVGDMVDLAAYAASLPKVATARRAKR